MGSAKVTHKDGWFLRVNWHQMKNNLLGVSVDYYGADGYYDAAKSVNVKSVPPQFLERAFLQSENDNFTIERY